MKQLFIRIGFVFALILISVGLYYAGKGHTLLLDNKNIEFNGNEYKALSIVEVKIDRGEEFELMKRDRIKEETSGQRHSITITYTDDNNEEKVLHESFKIKVGEPFYLLSIPALLGGDENWIQVFELLN